jgi:hypothetical protein
MPEQGVEEDMVGLRIGSLPISPDARSTIVEHTLLLKRWLSSTEPEFSSLSVIESLTARGPQEDRDSFAFYRREPRGGSRGCIQEPVLVQSLVLSQDH